eukprot:gene14178-biopygen8078
MGSPARFSQRKWSQWCPPVPSAVVVNPRGPVRRSAGRNGRGRARDASVSSNAIVWHASGTRPPPFPPGPLPRHVEPDHGRRERGEGREFSRLRTPGYGRMWSWNRTMTRSRPYLGRVRAPVRSCWSTRTR